MLELGLLDELLPDEELELDAVDEVDCDDCELLELLAVLLVDWLLVDSLDENDHVSIVVYAGASGVILEPTPGSEKAKILGALEQLQAGGGAAGTLAGTSGGEYTSIVLDAAGTTL